MHIYPTPNTVCTTVTMPSPSHLVNLIITTVTKQSVTLSVLLQSASNQSVVHEQTETTHQSVYCEIRAWLQSISLWYTNKY